MMSVEVLQVMARSFYGLAGVLFCVIFILFFQFQVWKMFADLFGIRKKREIQAIVRLESAQENFSQGILGMRCLQEEKTESFMSAEDTGNMDLESVSGTYCLIEKMEYIGSETWIE